MAGEEKMVGESWREAGARCFEPPKAPQMVTVLIWSLPKDGQGISLSSSPFQREMELTIQLGSKKDFKAMVQAETWFKDTQKMV